MTTFMPANCMVRALTVKLILLRINYITLHICKLLTEDGHNTIWRNTCPGSYHPLSQQLTVQRIPSQWWMNLNS